MAQEPPMHWRCQLKTDEQYKPCYASVLVLGKESLEERIEQVEQKLWPTFTAWCPQCRKPCMIIHEMDEFKTASAHHVHQLQQLDMIKKSNLFD